MECLTALWKDVWPVLTSVAGVIAPAFALQHWRIKATLSRHELKISATLDKKLKVKLEVDDANTVKIVPAPPSEPPKNQP